MRAVRSDGPGDLSVVDVAAPTPGSALELLRAADPAVGKILLHP
jgi:hypothetical protein